MLGSPHSHKSSKSDEKDDEVYDSITELPSTSHQLQHLVKGRPKRAKTRAPTKPLLPEHAILGIGDGLDHFFRPGSVTPTTLTPLVSPTSEECSSLSFVDSPTMSRDENGRFNLTSEETTPILEERKIIKLERASPVLKGNSWTARSRSSDDLEKFSPIIDRKSPAKPKTDASPIFPKHDSYDEKLNPPSYNNEGRLKSPSNDSIKSGTDFKNSNGLTKTPIAVQKPRPWSVAGNESKNNDFMSGDSTKTTPDEMDNSELL